ncbi:unnamed protein product [Lactuca virosa]|uniref:Uncharacterized protein n=1 Tax=Lactuca virosa TaxID=75947 RepID=A0AAU9MLH8_9ASTR|nr:unnamed protein product [Lactuca virosa]
MELPTEQDKEGNEDSSSNFLSNIKSCNKSWHCPWGHTIVQNNLGGKLHIIFSRLQLINAYPKGASVQEQTEETLSQENISEHGPRTPPPKAIAISSSPPTPSGTHATPITVPTPSHNLTTSSVPPSPSPVRGVLDNSVSVSTIPSSPINKEEEVGGFPVRKSSPALSESRLRNLGRGSLTSLTSLTSQSSVTVPINPTNNNIISTNNALGVGQASEMAKRPMLGTDERMVQQHPPVSSLSSRMMLPQSGVKSTDGDNGNGGEGGGMGTRVFSPSGVPGIQWRPGSSFQTQHEGGQFRGRTEIAPDQREKFLQRFQQILLSLVHLASLSSQSDLEANLFKLMERRGYGQEYINCYKMMKSSS